MLYLLTCHWLTMTGALLVTAGGCVWLLALPNLLRSSPKDPYIGILLFAIVPIFFVLGLILMPIGVWWSRHKIQIGRASCRERVYHPV